MGLQGEKKLEDILTGALIGLARTTYSHLKTENTDRVVTCALSVLVRVDADEKEPPAVSAFADPLGLHYPVLLCAHVRRNASV